MNQLSKSTTHRIVNIKQRQNHSERMSPKTYVMLPTASQIKMSTNTKKIPTTERNLPENEVVSQSPGIPGFCLQPRCTNSQFWHRKRCHCPARWPETLCTQFKITNNHHIHFSRIPLKIANLHWRADDTTNKNKMPNVPPSPSFKKTSHPSWLPAPPLLRDW